MLLTCTDGLIKEIIELKLIFGWQVNQKEFTFICEEQRADLQIWETDASLSSKSLL